uniref:F-box domain-containing protein n=1 Tax=Anopheles epiroticus TaxID=199890 RepID=A0A182PT52_9DIPT
MMLTELDGKFDMPLQFTREVQQFVQSVLHASHEYGPCVTYSSANLTGRPNNYPTYGDHADSYLLTSYGRWHSSAPSYTPEFGLANIPAIDNPPVDELLVVSFERTVYPTGLAVYETYNGGAVSRIWAFSESSEWHLLWDCRTDVELPQTPVDNDESEAPSHRARLFRPKIHAIQPRTRVLAIEFNMRDLSDIYGMDGIMLIGTLFPFSQQVPCDGLVPRALNRVASSALPVLIDQDAIQIMDLPYEMLVKILSFLDPPSLRNMEQVSYAFRQLVADNRLCRENLLVRCPSLIELSMRNTTIDTRTNERPRDFTHLQKLDLARTNVSTEALIEVLSLSPALQHLSIASCTEVNSGQIAEAVAMYNTQLVSLNLWKTCAFSETGLLALRVCTKLQELDIGYANYEATTEDTISQLLVMLPEMRKLVVPGVRPVKSADLLTIAHRCPRLEYLDLMGCVVVSIEAVHEVLAGCPALRFLEVSFCGISPACINDWRKEFPLVVIHPSVDAPPE